MGEAQLRQGALPRTVAPRPGPSHPRPTPEQVSKGEEFLAKFESFLRTHVDPLEIERDAKIPDQVMKGLFEIGALGMKIDEKYGGLGLSNLYYIKALELATTVSPAISTLLSAHQSIGAPQPLKLFGTDEQKQQVPPPPRPGRSERLPSDRTRRRQRPRPHDHLRHSRSTTAPRTS